MFEREYRDVARQRTEAVSYWRDNCENATWDGLADAVEKLGDHGNLVKKLRERAQDSNFQGGARLESSRTQYNTDDVDIIRTPPMSPGPVAVECPRIQDIFDHVSSLPSVTTSSSVEELDESSLASGTRKLQLDFAKLLTSIRLSLEKQQVSAGSLLSHLKTLEAIDPEIFDKTLPKTIESLEELFPAIAPYCSWFNHLLVENIVETFCEDNDRLLGKWKAFREEFASYCEARLCECPLDQFGEDPPRGDTTPVVMKIDSKWKAVKVSQLEVIRDTVAQILNIKPYNLYLRAVKNGCIELTFHIPNFVATKCLPPSSEQITALQNFGVIYIQHSHLKTAESAEKDVEIHQLQQELEHEQAERTRADNQIQQQTRELQQKTVELQQQTVELNSVQHRYQRLYAELEDREARLRAQEEEMQQRDAEINRLMLELRRCQAQLQRQQEGVSAVGEEPSQWNKGQQIRQTPLEELKSPLKLEWRQGDDMLFDMAGHIQAIAIGDNVYVGGGVSLHNAGTVMVYSVQTGLWTTLPLLETELFGMASVNHQLVLVGGESMSVDEVTNILVVWDEWSQTWTRPFPVMPTARYSPTVISYQKWLVVAGGVDERSFYLYKVELLDTRSGQWYEGSPLPAKCREMSSAINGNMWYLSGGASSQGQAIKHVFSVCLDELISQAVSQSATSPWQTLPAAPLERSTVLILNGALLTVGGLGSSSIHLYQPGSRSWVKVGDLPYDYTLCPCACTILPDGEMFVTSDHGVYIAQL